MSSTKMASKLSIIEWTEILQNSEITHQIDLSIFQALYSFENYEAPASQIGILLGYKGKNTSSPLNLEIGRYAKRIAKFYDISFTERNNLKYRKDKKYKFWDIFFDGRDEPPFFIWRLNNKLKAALEQTNLTGQMYYPEEVILDKSFNLQEGLKKTIIVNSYERNPKARKLCIEHRKPICSVCSFNFEERYGDIGKGFIHVHHLKQISEIGETYQVDPINDLRPVCPNCHCILHKKNPPYTIEELQSIIEDIHITL